MTRRVYRWPLLIIVVKPQHLRGNHYLNGGPIGQPTYRLCPLAEAITEQTKTKDLYYVGGQVVFYRANTNHIYIRLDMIYRALGIIALLQI